MDIRNVFECTGVLSEKDLAVKHDKNGREFIGGNIVLKGDYGTVRLRVYCYAQTKNGSEHPMHAGIYKLCNEYVSGVEAAKTNSTPDFIKVKGKIEINDYVDKNGALKTSTTYKVESVHRMEETNTYFEAEVSGCLCGFTEEKRNEEPTGRMIVKIVSKDFRGQAIPLNLIASNVVVDGENVDMAEIIENNFEVGDNTVFYINLQNRIIGGTKSKKASFGRASKIVNGYSVQELVIVGLEEPTEPIEDENGEITNVITLEEVRQMMNERNIKLKELEDKGYQGGKNTKAPGAKAAPVVNNNIADLFEVTYG